MADADRLRRLEAALIKADEAGNVDDARALAAAIRAERGASQESIPPGMTAQEASERDIRAIMADADYRSRGLGGKIVAGAASALRGVPFVGEYVDELAGAMGGEAAANRMRVAQEGFERANPALSTGLQIATGVATGIPMAIAAAPYVGAAAPATMLGQVAAGTGAGAVAGALEGGISGFGAGQGDWRARLEEAARRGAIGAGMGGAVGAAAPLVSRGVGTVVQGVRDRADAIAARRIGTSPEAIEAVGRALDSDGPARAVANIRAAGPEAMIADAGESTARVLDTAIQRSGGGAGAARQAVEQRVSAASKSLTEALDDLLGPPTAARITTTPAERAAMSRLYDRAYSKPINYSSPTGRKIEDLLTRVPARAINAANEMMRLEGVRSGQILADIADDGTVTFRTMPDVRQIDYITRGLRQAAETGETAGALGGRTPISRLYNNLAREIRDALKTAVPEYGVALNRAADHITQQQARDLGEKALRTSMSRADLADELAGMPEVAKARLRQGVRAYIDDLMANTKRAMTDGDMDAREAFRALKELTSRASREKLGMIMPKSAAAALQTRMDRAVKAFELRARVAGNSATAAREAVQRRVAEIMEPGAIGTLIEGGDIPGAGRKVIQALAGTPPTYRRELEERIYSDIVDLLTTRRGPDAERAVAELTAILSRSQATSPLAQRIGQAAAAASAVGAYQSAEPLLAR